MIEKIEAHSFLSTPPSHAEMYDGWLLRSADGRTKRFNSVNFPSFANGVRPVEEKIKFCEDFYAQRDMPCRFRVTPLTRPKNLEDTLISKGYVRVDPTNVCVQTLREFGQKPSNIPVKIESEMSEKWLTTLCQLTSRDAAQKEAFSQMSSRLTIAPYFASVMKGDEIAAVGFATSHNGIIGLFEFATDPNHRRLGLAAAIVQKLLMQAQNSRTTLAYLQVVQSNIDGQKFWASMGFTKPAYAYSYLCKTN